MARDVVLITGCTSGIGRVTAIELARRGARVVLANRSAEKTGPVLEQIRQQSGDQAAEFLPVDLSSFASIRKAAADFLARGLPLQTLVNNAGIIARGATAEGFELTFGVNHIGHFLLTSLLLGRLRDSAPSRVVTVASDLHRVARRIDYQKIRRTTASRTAIPEYAASKLANILFSAELGRRLAGTGVTTYSLHPGSVATGIWRRIPWPFRPVVLAFMRSPERGARTSIHCATSPDLTAETGLYYENCEPAVPSALARDTALAVELWECTTAWCA